MGALLYGLSVCVGACARSTDTLVEAQLAGSTSAAAPLASFSKGPGRSSGDNPFAFHSGPSAARAGDYVLVPSKSSLDRAFSETGLARSLFYSGAWVEQALEKETRVRWLTQQRGSVPNALVIPIPPGEVAKPGDVVLTSGQGGTGLLRAFVVGGSPEAPMVRALDAAAGDPALLAGQPQVLPKQTFHVLKEAGEVGSSIACRRGDRAIGMILLSRFGEQLLGLGFAGTTEAFPASTCRMLPLSPELVAGSRVFVQRLERFIPARVLSVQADTGRVSVQFTFAGEERQADVGAMNVATTLPP